MSRRSEHTTKVFVGSLPPNVTDEDLRQLFANFGPIAECDIANRCGFLHLEDKDLAEKAINELNNSTFMGARISVEKGRVKPRGERRMGRGAGGGGGAGGPGRGGGMGRKRDMGPYSRDGGGFGRGGMPPRNGGGGGGNYRDDYRNYDDFRDFGRYDDRYERRPPMYEERRGGGGGSSGGGSYMNDRNSYGNGYERRPYEDRNPPYGGGNNMPPRQYDDNRMPPSGPGSYEDRRPPMNDRRPLLDDQNMSQNPMRQQNYDRQAQPQNDMFSRRDGPPKPLSGAYDRSSQGGGGGGGGSYSSYGNSNSSYSNAAPQGGGGSYGGGPNSYNQSMQGGGGGGGFGDRGGPNQGFNEGRGQAPAMNNAGYSSSQGGGYNSSQQSGGPAGGGYGDNYGMRSQNNTYDAAYPPLPQQRGFTGGNAPGPHRDMRAGGRF